MSCLHSRGLFSLLTTTLTADSGLGMCSCGSRTGPFPPADPSWAPPSPETEVWGWKHRNRESSQDPSLLLSLDGTENRLRTSCCSRGRDLGLLWSLGRLKDPKRVRMCWELRSGPWCILSWDAGTGTVLREGSHQDRELQSRAKPTVTARAGAKGPTPTREIRRRIKKYLSPWCFLFLSVKQSSPHSLSRRAELVKGHNVLK